MRERNCRPKQTLFMSDIPQAWTISPLASRPKNLHQISIPLMKQKKEYLNTSFLFLSVYSEKRNGFSCEHEKFNSSILAERNCFRHWARDKESGGLRRRHREKWDDSHSRSTDGIFWSLQVSPTRRAEQELKTSCPSHFTRPCATSQLKHAVIRLDHGSPREPVDSSSALAQSG